MDYTPLIPLAWWAVGILAFVLLLKWMQRRGWIDTDPNRVHRGTGHAMMGLREFIEPSVQHVIKAEHAEPEQDAQGDKP
jgi:hypothetical protein